MSTLTIDQWIVLAVVLAPGFVFTATSILWLLGNTLREKSVARITAAVFLSSVCAVAILAWRMSAQNLQQVAVPLGTWFQVHEYRFPLLFLADRVSMPFIGLTVVLAGLIGQFSATYLHRDGGFYRFYVLLHLFAFGSLLTFTAGSLDLMLAGWELVGITSVLLIGFFQYRREPVESALRVFGIYRACDIGLLTGIFALHHWAGRALLTSDIPHLSGAAATTTGLLLLLAAAGKSAQVPFSSWLPRAMEGPTPSSAIFYGAISVHAGAYLLLRTRPMWDDSLLVHGAVITAGAVTALLGSMTGRVCSDAKTALAYASLTQVGVIFAEIGLGWTLIPIIHILGHACVRTLQFLRAPSMLHDYHQIHAAAGGHLGKTGQHIESSFPVALQLYLYRGALDRWHLDAILDRLFISPLMRLSGLLSKLDGAGGGWRQAPSPARPRAMSANVEEVVNG